MVLAVNCAPQAPADGQATCSSSSRSSSDIVADRMLADRLEHVLHGDRLALEGAGQDRAAIDEDRRHVEPAHRHHHAGQRLVAAGEADQRVIGMAAHGQFDGVGDHLARRQRGLHAVVAHGDAVGDGDGAELARRAAGGRDALLHRLRLAHQRDVAGRGLVPAGRDADERLVDLLPWSDPWRNSRSGAARAPGPRSRAGWAAWPSDWSWRPSTFWAPRPYSKLTDTRSRLPRRRPAEHVLRVLRVDGFGCALFCGVLWPNRGALTAGTSRNQNHITYVATAPHQCRLKHEAKREGGPEGPPSFRAVRNRRSRR